jgi:hypothetical protein
LLLPTGYDDRNEKLSTRATENHFQPVLAESD